MTLRRFGTRLRRTLRLVHINREVFVFCVFLLVAIIFWFLQTFNESTTAQLTFHLRLTDIPQNVIITSDVPATVTANVKGRGFSILEYLTKTPNHQIDIPYTEYLDENGTFVIDQNSWRKLLTQTLSPDISLISVSPQRIELYHSTGDHKYVPVILNGKIKVDNQHVLCDVQLAPTYVDIYAPEALFDTITAVPTQPLRLNNLKDTLRTRLPLAPPIGVKCLPDTIDVTVCVDLYTTKTLKVPIYCENSPQNVILRTFPMAADVTFRVSASNYDQITPEDFVLVVDYSDIHQGQSKCPLIMRDQPDIVGSVQYTPKEVDYIIEQEQFDDDNP